jgi:hydroxyethylthiazole kinase-like uncharacterized protein yjeF
MKLPKAHEMQALDRCAIEDFGIPGSVLMENAGLGTVLMMERELGSCKGKFALIFIGPGNNGGDGLVIGRHLHQRGCQPIFFFLVPPDSLKGDAATNLHIMRKLKLPFHIVDNASRVETIPVLYKQIESRGKPCHCVIDAIFGTGLLRGLDGHFADAINLINRPDFAHNVPVVAVDTPSGMDSDSGRILGTSIVANLTATYGCAKPGQIMQGSSELTGKLQIIDIGIPPEAFARSPIPTELLTADIACSWLKKLSRDKSSHKGSHGHLFIIAGSAGKTGAAILAAQGAIRSGCGLVSLAAPYTLNAIFETNLVEAMTVPLPTSSSLINVSDLSFIQRNLSYKNGVVIGPGLGQDKRTAELVIHLYNSCSCPMVVDADALNILAANREKIAQPAGPRILTPHPGEVARLSDSTPQIIQDNRFEAAREAHIALDYDKKVIIVLKGDGTVIVSDEGYAMINTSGNPGMATGGMGDVLSGVIGSLISQGLNCLEAAAAGVFLHGKAADDIHVKASYGYTATEVAERIPFTLKNFLQQEIT